MMKLILFNMILIPFMILVHWILRSLCSWAPVPWSWNIGLIAIVVLLNLVFCYI
jgi:hypothetical protein